jgi:amidohydrolase
MASYAQWYDSATKIYNQFEMEFGEIFRHLHQHPELGGSENATSEYLRDLFDRNTNYQIIEQAKNGFIVGYPPVESPRICLRSDMDALAIEEKTKLPYMSENQGVMHACGHDFHSVFNYAVALLWEKLVGQVDNAPVFMFQHSEETIPGGALDFIQKDAHRLFSEIYGLHVEPALPTGTISLTDGWVNAQSIKFNVEIEAKGGHSARPWEAEDPLKTSIDIINDLYGTLPRKVNVQTPFILSVTEFNTESTAYNVFPRKVKWGGTLRITDGKLYDLLIKSVQDTIFSYCKRDKLVYQFYYTSGAPPVVNPLDNISKADSLKDFLMNEKKWNFTTYRSLGGEDFGWFNQLRKGFLIRVGASQDPLAASPLHSNTFKADFAALRYAVLFYFLFLLDRTGRL